MRASTEWLALQAADVATARTAPFMPDEKRAEHLELVGQSAGSWSTSKVPALPASCTMPLLRETLPSSAAACIHDAIAADYRGLDYFPCGRTGRRGNDRDGDGGPGRRLNGASALDGKVALNRGIVQVAGSAGTMKVNRIARLANEFEPFRSVLIRHEQVLFAQAQQSAGCNASHSVEARMCRWLLLCAT